MNEPFRILQNAIVTMMALKNMIGAEEKESEETLNA